MTWPAVWLSDAHSSVRFNIRLTSIDLFSICIQQLVLSPVTWKPDEVLRTLRGYAGVYVQGSARGWRRGCFSQAHSRGLLPLSPLDQTLLTSLVALHSFMWFMPLNFFFFVRWHRNGHFLMTSSNFSFIPNSLFPRVTLAYWFMFMDVEIRACLHKSAWRGKNPHCWSNCALRTRVRRTFSSVASLPTPDLFFRTQLQDDQKIRGLIEEGADVYVQEVVRFYLNFSNPWGHLITSPLGEAL